MNAASFQDPGDTQQYAQSWAFSVALHTLAVAVAVFTVTDLTLAPQTEIFQWDVAMVQPAEPAQLNPPSPPMAKPDPIPPAPEPQQLVKKSARVEKAQPVQTVRQEIRRQEVREVQTIERVPVPSNQQPVQQPQQIMAEPIEIPQEAVPVRKEVTHQMETREVAHETTITTTDAQPIPQETVLQTRENRPVTETTTQTVEPQQVVHETVTPAVETRQVTETAMSAVETPPVETPPTVQETAAITSNQALTQQIVQETTPVYSDESPVASPPIVEAKLHSQAQKAIEEQAVTKEQPAARQIPVHSRPATRADHGWLAKDLWAKVERLKRYPAMARMNHWEGQVVLRAVIKDTGELVGLQVTQSSGHAVLDRDAMEIMRKACPIALKHSLGQREVVLEIPISYGLK